MLGRGKGGLGESFRGRDDAARAATVKGLGVSEDFIPMFSRPRLFNAATDVVFITLG